MKLLSWNILHGGGQRAQDILDTIEKEQPDIVTLQEFRHGSSNGVRNNSSVSSRHQRRRKEKICKA